MPTTATGYGRMGENKEAETEWVHGELVDAQQCWEKEAPGRLYLFTEPLCISLLHLLLETACYNAFAVISNYLNDNRDCGNESEQSP